jgi:outer membrane lipoprotein-sorting protein
VAAKTLAVAAEPNLPPRTAAQLLVDLQTAQLDGLSGTVVERADLGLPALPSLLGDQSSELTSLVSGKHTLRVWYSGPDKARVSLLGTQGQSDIIHNGTDTWIWNSKSGKAQHFKDSGEDAAAKGPGAMPSTIPSEIPKSPQEAADLALKAIDPTTQVSIGNSAKIAGRDAYELILRPRDTASLVGQVRLAIDAKEKLPLRVQVLAKGQSNPAFEVAFTQVSFARPDDGQFAFNPPAGTKVEEADPAAAAADAQKHDETASGEKPKSTVIGTGWTSVLVLRTSQPGQAAGTDVEAKKAQDAIAQLPLGNGGRTFNSKLFSVLITDDGRVLVGAVSPERLSQVAADPAAALK